VGEINEAIVCPLWDSQDHRFHARHYTVWTRKCRRCQRDVAVADALKRQADAGEVQFLCEQCDLGGKSKVAYSTQAALAAKYSVKKIVRFSWIYARFRSR
jgi:hypothetical protein